MFTKEELLNFIDELRNKLGNDTSALISDDLITIISNYNNAIDKINELNDSNLKLKNEYDEVLKVNGKLFQKIGVENQNLDENNENFEESKELKNSDDLKLEDIVDEKGDLK